MQANFEKSKRQYQKLIDEASSRYTPELANDVVGWERVDLWFEQESDKIKKVFRGEYDSYCKEGLYFYGCTFSIYEATYEDRSGEYVDEFDDHTPLSFIRHELDAEGVLEIKYRHADEELKKQMRSSLHRRFEFLQEKARELGYHLTTSSSQPYKLEPLPQPNKNEEDSYPDLSDSNYKQKVIFLHELGVIEFLREKHLSFATSTNELSAAISGFTGIKKSTVQSYINPIINIGTSQKNNPFSNNKNVSKVRNKLINLGVDLDLGNT